MTAICFIRSDVFPNPVVVLHPLAHSFAHFLGYYLRRLCPWRAITADFQPEVPPIELLGVQYGHATVR